MAHYRSSERGPSSPTPLRSRRRDEGRGQAVSSDVSASRGGARVLDGLTASSLMAWWGGFTPTPDRSKTSATGQSLRDLTPHGPLQKHYFGRFAEQSGPWRLVQLRDLGWR